MPTRVGLNSWGVWLLPCCSDGGTGHTCVGDIWWHAKRAIRGKDGNHRLELEIWNSMSGLRWGFGYGYNGDGWQVRSQAGVVNRVVEL